MEMVCIWQGLARMRQRIRKQILKVTVKMSLYQRVRGFRCVRSLFLRKRLRNFVLVYLSANFTAA